MTIKITGSDKTIELHDNDPETGIDHIGDTLGDALGREIIRTADGYTCDQDTADW